MPQPNDFDRKIRELEESNRILQIENDELADRAEDTLLLGLIAEQIYTAEEIEPMLERALERISVLKDIPFCACCSLSGNEAVVIKAYLSISDDDLDNCVIVLPDGLLRDVIDVEFPAGSGISEEAGLSINLASGIFKPTSVCCIPFISRYTAANLFIFADDRPDNRFPRLSDMLHRVVEMTVSRVDNIMLFQELRSLNRALDKTVEERTRELRKREHEFRSLAENLPDNIVRYDLEGRSVYVNPELEKTLGADAARMLGTLVHEFHPDGSYEVYEQALNAALASGKNVEIEFILPSSGTEPVVHQIRFIAERDEHGEMTGVLAIGRDITERKRAGAALAASEQHFRSLAENSPDNIVRYDRQCRARYYNPRMLQTLGAAPEMIVGKTPVELGAGGLESDTEYEAHIRRVLESGESNDMELTLQLPGGAVSNHLIRFAPERDAQGAIVGVLAIGRNITERKRVEDALLFIAQRGWQNSGENFFDALAQFLGEKLDMDYVLIDRVDENPDMAETVAFYAVGEIKPNIQYPLKGTPCENVMGRQLSFYPRGVQQLFPGDILLPEMGAESYIGIPLWDSTGKPIGLIAVMDSKPLSDNAPVTQLLQLVATRAAAELERKHAEEEIQKLNQELEQRVQDRTAQLVAVNEELETFAYSVSHDLRSPLRHVIGYVDLLVSHCRDSLDNKGLHYLDTVSGSARRMSVLIDDLLQFSRTGRAEISKGNMSMGKALQEVQTQLKESYSGRNIEWVIGELPSVQGDFALLRQVWANLLENAIKYTRPRDVARIQISARKENGEIIFAVSDNGVGFDMQYADRLFGVFQRLHSVEEFEGSGIGLATIQRIISRHGGRVWAEGKVDEGATFYFTIPTLEKQNEF